MKRKLFKAIVTSDKKHIVGTDGQERQGKMTKKQFLKLLNEARDDVWDATMQFEGEYKPATFPYQADGRLTMADIGRAHLGGVCNGFDAVIHALESGSDFKSLKGQARKVAKWHVARAHEAKMVEHEKARDSR
jgi:hypothetical protein